MIVYYKQIKLGAKALGGTRPGRSARRGAGGPFTIDVRRVRPERATDADTEAATAFQRGVARVDSKAPVKPGERFTFAINASGMQFPEPRHQRGDLELATERDTYECRRPEHVA